MDINFKIEKCHIYIDMSKPPVSDSVNYLTAVFDFDEEWQGFTKTAVFTGKANVFNVLLDNNKCVIPHEVLQGKYFTVSVFGIKEEVRITATELFIPLDKSGYMEGETPSEPTPTVYEEILTQLTRIGSQQDYEALSDEVEAAKSDLAEIKNNVHALVQQDGFQDTNIAYLGSALNEKADKSTTYTKSEIGNLSDLITENKDSIVEAVNEHNDKIDIIQAHLGYVHETVGNLSDLIAENKDSIVEAVNEVDNRTRIANAGMTEMAMRIGNLSDLTTTDKTSAVNAINEVNDTKIPKDWKQFCETVTITQEDIAAAGDNGITRMVVGDGNTLMPSGISELKVRFYIPKSSDLNTATPGICCDISNSISYVAGKTYNKLTHGSTYTFIKDYNTHYDIHTQINRHNGCGYLTVLNKHNFGADNHPAAVYGNALSGNENITGLPYVRIYGTGSFKFPVGTTMSVYYR